MNSEEKREREIERIQEQREVERDIYSERQITRKTHIHCVRERYNERQRR